MTDSEMGAIFVAGSALAAWLARELTFKQWRRHQSELHAIIVNDKEGQVRRRCLLDYVPSCALYRPDIYDEEVRRGSGRAEADDDMPNSTKGGRK